MFEHIKNYEITFHPEGYVTLNVSVNIPIEYTRTGYMFLYIPQREDTVYVCPTCGRKLE